MPSKYKTVNLKPETFDMITSLMREGQTFDDFVLSLVDNMIIDRALCIDYGDKLKLLELNPYPEATDYSFGNWLQDNLLQNHVEEIIVPDCLTDAKKLLQAMALKTKAKKESEE